MYELIEVFVMLCEFRDLVEGLGDYVVVVLWVNFGKPLFTLGGAIWHRNKSDKHQ